MTEKQTSRPICKILGPCVEQIIPQYKGSDMERVNTHFSSINVQIFAKLCAKSIVLCAIAKKNRIVNNCGMYFKKIYQIEFFVKSPSVWRGRNVVALQSVSALCKINSKCAIGRFLSQTLRIIGLTLSSNSSSICVCTI